MEIRRHMSRTLKRNLVGSQDACIMSNNAVKYLKVKLKLLEQILFRKEKIEKREKKKGKD